MMRHQLLQDEGVLVVSPEGSLTSEDFAALAREVDPYIERNGKLAGLLIEAASFPGWHDFGALIAHLRFVRDHHRKINRVAVVSDSQFLSVAPRIAEHFVAAEVKHFPAGQRQAALDWLSGA
jgi:hypothetical protein